MVNLMKMMIIPVFCFRLSGESDDDEEPFNGIVYDGMMMKQYY